LTHFSPATVSASSALDLLDSCHTLGIDCQELAGIKREALLDPEARISESHIIALWHEMAAHSALPHFALLVGQQINPAAKGLLASWVSQCDSLGEALKVFMDNISLMSPSEHWQLNQQGHETTLAFTINDQYPINAIERSMSALVTWGRALTAQPQIQHQSQIQPQSQTFTLSNAQFCFEKPGHHQHYPPIFGDNLEFNSHQNALVFDSNLLSLPINSHNEFLKGVMEQKALHTLKVLQSDAALSEKIKAIIQKNLKSHKATIDEVSRELNMSRQTLYRKLKSENTDFKTLINEVRKSTALELLAAPNSTILSTSLELGFKETSSFYKAFKRWYGKSLSEYSK
jgi:AraC-like DNA-binding protein